MLDVGLTPLPAEVLGEDAFPTLAGYIPIAKEDKAPRALLSHILWLMAAECGDARFSGDVGAPPSHLSIRDSAFQGQQPAELVSVHKQHEYKCVGESIESLFSLVEIAISAPLR